MKSRFLALALTLTLLPAGRSLLAQDATIKVSSVMHADGSRTETQTNLEEGTAEEKTLNAAGKLMRRTVYKLDEFGRPAEGTAYSDKNVPLHRFAYTRDTLGRISEEKNFSLDGQLRYRLVYRFGSNGRVVGIDTYDAQGNLVRGGSGGGSKKQPQRRGGR